MFNKTGFSDYFSVFVTYMSDCKEFSYYYPRVEYVNVTMNSVGGCLFNAGGEAIFSYVGRGDMVEIHLNIYEGIFEKIV